MAKAPAPGRSKTRLCPPCTPGEAAELAEAALRDTLAAVAGASAGERVLALEGEPGDWLPAEGFRVVAQCAGGLGERMAGALSAVGGPALVIGMDTPQLTAALLDDALDRLEDPGAGAVLGAAGDGGYWAIGLQAADAEVFTGVPMSTAETAAEQRRRLGELGLSPSELPVLRDVDTIADAFAVAEAAPESRFAATLARMDLRTPR